MKNIPISILAAALLAACSEAPAPQQKSTPTASSGRAYAVPTGWITDMAAAQTQAKAENKKILALFTGSDWCPTCEEWDKDVFSKPEFLPFATNQFVLLYVDFPDKHELPAAQLAANKALERKYDADEYPLVYILDSEGKELMHFKHIEGGMGPFKEKLAELSKITPPNGA